MTTAVQRRRGTNTEHATFTGLDGEITVNTTTYTLHVHDGSTVGGIVLAKADGSNISTSSIDINGGTIDGTVIGGSSAAAGSFTSLTATSANVNGTVTADGLNVGNDGQIYFASTAARIEGTSSGADNINIYANNALVAKFQAGGDLSLYEDTGTTAKFFWDASAESLGIGTTSPDATGLHITRNNGNAELRLTRTGTFTGDFKIYSGGGATNRLVFRDMDANSDRLTIDSSGNVLVGTTDSTPYNNSGAGNTGIALLAAGAINLASEGAAGDFNRLATDGDIVRFRKDGTVVGSIGNSGTNLYIGSQDAGISFGGGADAITPFNVSTGADRDAAIDLGTVTGSTRRFRNLYLSGGVYLGGTGADNLLDDYETGTFTPTLRFATEGDTSIIYGTRTGTYTKIGNKVFYKVSITTSTFTHTTASSFLKITGFPFTPSSSYATSIGNMKHTGLSVASSSNVDSIYPIVISANTECYFQWSIANGTSGTNYITAGQHTSGNNVQIFIDMVVETD